MQIEEGHVQNDQKESNELAEVIDQGHFLFEEFENLNKLEESSKQLQNDRLKITTEYQSKLKKLQSQLNEYMQQINETSSA